MKKVSMLAVLILTLGWAAGSAGPVQDDLASPGLRIEWAEFKKLYDSGKVIVADVRSLEAYEAGHIPGSRSVPLEQVARRASELKKSNTPVVFYCA